MCRLISQRAIKKKYNKAGADAALVAGLNAVEQIVLHYMPKGTIRGIFFRCRLAAVLKEAGEDRAVAFVVLYSTPENRRQLTALLRKALKREGDTGLDGLLI